MEIGIRYNHQDEWKKWSDVLSGIASIRPYEQIEVLFVSERPIYERETLLSGITVVRRICGTSASIFAVGPYPSLEWISTLKCAGVVSVWSASARGQRLGRVSLENAVQLTEAVCPALHTKENEGKAHSVCGCHNDRMVLAHHHLKKWCLEKKDECPHWNENAERKCIA